MYICDSHLSHAMRNGAALPDSFSYKLGDYPFPKTIQITSHLKLFQLSVV